MVFLAFVLLVGGSSRADVTSLVLLRPVAVMVAAYAMLTLPRPLWRENRFIIGLAALIVLLPALQLVPLPPAVWTRLAGRDLVTGIDQAAGLRGLWRPLTLSPAGTWNALFSLAVPVGMLFAGLRLDQRQRLALVPFGLALILASAALGTLQVIGPNGGPLYLYRITHPDSAVGFLANRNHQAAFVGCAFPIMAILATHSAFAERFYSRPLFAALVAAFLIPLILIIGSRAGLAVSAVAIGLATLLYMMGIRARGEKIGRRVALFLGGACLAIPALAALAVWLDRAEALERALGWKSERDFRLQAWDVIETFLRHFWPWGTGMGSFVEVYKVYEPRALLNPEYVNQAHNDWLEIWLTGGIFAGGLLVLAVAAWLWRAWQARKPGERSQLTRLGLAVIMLFALASVTDYPLRVPSMAAFFTLAVLWALPTRSVPLGRTP
jgi:O-antigen ligase